MTHRYEPLDATGRKIRIGDVVRIVGVPDLTGMSQENLKETRPVFEYLVGKYKRVREFDDQGCIWIYFRIMKGPHGGMHGVGIEPFLLRVRRARKKM